MASIAEFVLPMDAFPLGRVHEEFPNVVMELERVVPVEDTVMPFFWVTNLDGDADADVLADAIEDVLGDLRELRTVVCIEVVGPRALFRAEWEPEFIGIMAAIADADLTVVSASGGGDQWTFELRAMDAEHLAAFQEFCATNDIPVQLRRLHRLSEAPQGEYGLTSAQQEALALAFKRGYYESPAAVSLEDLGAELGITGQSMGSRLRRGMRTLIASTVVEST